MKKMNIDIHKLRISFFEYIVMLMLWLFYIRYYYGSIGMTNKINLIKIIFGFCCYFAVFYETTLKLMIRNREFNNKNFIKVFIVWILPLLIGVFSTNIVFPYIKAHDNTKIHIQLNTLGINITNG